MSPRAALDGVRVLDLTRYIPGPYCTQILADLGADVVKIEEPPVGDPTRAVPPAVGEDSALHAALNRNKRSVLLDLRSDDGVAVAKRLARTADVLVETFRPGVLARRGLGAKALCDDNPRLVYCSLSGYGQDGPLASRAGHDIDYIALGGLLGSNLGGDGRPVLPVTQVADMVGGLVGALGVLAALQARERTGRGQVVDASMLDAVLSLMTIPATRLMAGGPAVDELGGTQPSYNVYRCRDGRYLAVGALEPKFWEKLCGALGMPERASRQWLKGERRAEAVEAFATVFASRDRDEWVRELQAHDVCVEPVLSLEETLAQPQAQRMMVEQPLTAGPALTPSPSPGPALTPDPSPSGRGEFFRTFRTPVRLSETPTTVRRGAPALGEHTDGVLAEAGFSREEIERMREAGVLA